MHRGLIFRSGAYLSFRRGSQFGNVIRLKVGKEYWKLNRLLYGSLALPAAPAREAGDRKNDSDGAFSRIDDARFSHTPLL